MAKRICDCENISVVEGIFGELCPGKPFDISNLSLNLVYSEYNVSENSKDDLKKVDSSLTSSLGEGDCHTSKPNSNAIPIKSYTLINANRMEVMIITYGATIVSIKCPDKYGDTADIVLGYEDINSYVDPTLNPFMGCILGRCANRIKDGKFKIKDTDYSLTKNDMFKHHIHGGTDGFGKRLWEAHVEDCSYVVMSYLSDDGEEGYPGALLTTVKFKLTNENRLEISMRATTSKPTVVNLSYGTVFNLAGHDAGEDELRAHKISLNCDRWTFSEFENPLPTGAIRNVGGTIMDLRIPRFLGELLEKVPQDGGFDHNFCVVRSSQPEPCFVARVLHANSGRYIELYSDQPGVHLYTCGRFPPYRLKEESTESSKSSSSAGCECECDCESLSDSQVSIKSNLEYLPGKRGAKYTRFTGFSIQPQNYPDAVNIPHFPCAILRPGQVYYHDLVYKFGVQLGGYA
ncbi:hypothetical protein QAD02_019619 [Eretmocerus hayati]|uniref:Uncharacterized protein n=1 Tax=Eretmocerus hayati TaxID=131215 RepID=A0ACC2PKC8_9HYME|nr:hypothetical protein QAD02_019619 [Eretmocerus hayati]